MVTKRFELNIPVYFKVSMLLAVTALFVACSPGSETIPEPEGRVQTQAQGTASPTARITTDEPSTPAEPTVETTESAKPTGNPSGPDSSNVATSGSDNKIPGDWRDLPVVPEFSDRARAIFQAGIEAGNDPRVFAKVGDCQNVPSMFLSIFDHPGYYTLGDEYDYLQETIDWYSGSFSRESEAVRRGFNAASVVSAVWADPEACEQGETPLECEIRLNNPSVAIISLETWWAGNPENYEKYVREIIEGLLEQDILPIVATKADNLEGEHQINEILVRLAQEYQIPVWNFWRAVQPLPGNGLMEDQFHLTFDGNHFDDPDAMQAAWPWRNLTALQVLDKVRTELADPE